MSTFVDDLEEVVEKVSDWAADITKDVADLLAPDGRPFGMDVLTEEEELTEYSKLAGNPQAWTAWINNQVLNLVTGLSQKGINPEAIAAIKPTEIVGAYAIDYSVRMEKKLQGDL